MPMPMGKTVAKKPDQEEKPKHPEQPPAPASIRKPESTGAAAKAIDPKRTSLLSPVRILPRKPEPVERPSVAPQAPDAGASRPASKSPQTLRTAPMSMIRALPRKTEPSAKAPAEPPSTDTGLIPTEPAPPPDTVRFAPEDTVPESEKTAQVPPVSSDTLFLKKSLRRTTGSLPALVKALADKPEEETVALTDAPMPAETEATPEPASEIIAEEPPPESDPAPSTSWFRSLAQKVGLWKSGEPSLPEEPTEITEPENETTEPVVEKEESAAGKFKPLTRLPAPETEPPESTSKIPQPLTRLPKAPDDLDEPEEPPVKPASKKPQPLKRLPGTEGKSLPPITRPLKPLTRLPDPDEGLSDSEEKPVEPITRPLKPLTRLPATEESLADSGPESTAEKLASPDPDASSKPSRLPRFVVIGLVVLVVVVGLTALVLSYVRGLLGGSGESLGGFEVWQAGAIGKRRRFPSRTAIVEG